MQKLHKDNYTLVKTYHFIALFDIIEKIFKSRIARKINTITKIYHLLSNTYFGGRKNTSTEYAIHFLIKKIYATWNQKEKASILMLDITEVFDNIS